MSLLEASVLPSRARITSLGLSDRGRDTPASRQDASSIRMKEEKTRSNQPARGCGSDLKSYQGPANHRPRAYFQHVRKPSPHTCPCFGARFSRRQGTYSKKQIPRKSHVVLLMTPDRRTLRASLSPDTGRRLACLQKPRRTYTGVDKPRGTKPACRLFL